VANRSESANPLTGTRDPASADRGRARRYFAASFPGGTGSNRTGGAGGVARSSLILGASPRAHELCSWYASSGHHLLLERLDAPNLLLARARAMLLYILARLGDTEAAEQILAGFGSQDRECGEMRTAAAALRLAQGNPSALAALAPVLDGSASALPWGWLPHAFLLFLFLLDPAPDLLRSHARQRTAELTLSRAPATWAC